LVLRVCPPQTLLPQSEPGSQAFKKRNRVVSYPQWGSCLRGQHFLVEATLFEGRVAERTPIIIAMNRGLVMIFERLQPGIVG
jgi:hypothetical protein